MYDSPEKNQKINLPPNTTLIINPQTQTDTSAATATMLQPSEASSDLPTNTMSSSILASIENPSPIPNSLQTTFSLLPNQIYPNPPTTAPSSNSPHTSYGLTPTPSQIYPTLLNPNPIPPTVTFFNSEEIPKFRGRRLQTDEMFVYGPNFNEFIENLNAYFIRHQIINDEEKINALRLLVHPTQGDARFVLAHFLDPSLNRERFSFNQLVNYLKRSYTTKEETNFFQAASHFIDLIRKKDSLKDFKKIREIQNAINQIMETFKRRESFTLSPKNTEQHCMELLLHLALSYLGGEKLTTNVLEKAPTNEAGGLLGLRCVEFLMRESLTNNMELHHIKEDFPASRPCSALSRDSRSGREMPLKTDESKTTKNVLCYKCGMKNHISPDCRIKKLYCSHCKINTHNTVVCRKKFRQQKRYN